jgi:ATPase subunit of ABC transporter with duplicated ATPase domains
MISFANINKQYGKQLLFVDASFQLNPGEKVGLVGPNGAGKTTLFRIKTRGTDGRFSHFSKRFTGDLSNIQVCVCDGL